jgi:membrane-associated phospholipid phosphatase
MLETLFQQSLEFTLFLQSIGEWLTPIMRAFTFLGNEEFYLLIMPVLVWSVDYTFGIRMGVLLLSTGSVNWITKTSLHQPRPFWIDRTIQHLDSAWTDFGMPSGHAMNAAALFGLVAASVKRYWVTILAVFVFFMIGFSRIYLGVHFTVSVVFGWVLGLVALWIFLTFESRVTNWFKSISVPIQIGTMFAISIALTLIGVGARALVLSSGFELLDEWVANAALAQPEEAIDPLSLNGLITNTGALFGLACGAIWISQSGGFNAASGPWWKRVLRFLVGLVGIAVLWQGLGAVLPRTPDLTGYTLRYLRYALVGFWATGIAPWLFIKIGIGEQK